jgi:hypothetical protein
VAQEPTPHPNDGDGATIAFLSFVVAVLVVTMAILVAQLAG